MTDWLCPEDVMFNFLFSSDMRMLAAGLLAAVIAFLGRAPGPDVGLAQGVLSVKFYSAFCLVVLSGIS